MKRFLKKFMVFMASTLFLFAVVASPSLAQTEGQARTTAVNEQRSDCSGSNPALYACQNALFLAPVCYGTGVDQVGKAQWVCGGVFTRRRRLVNGGTPYCQTTYVLSPFGRVMNYPTYTCYKTLPL